MNKKYFMLLLGGLICTGALAQVTPYGWRGPEHNGYYPDKGLLKEWPAEGPTLVFETLEIDCSLSVFMRRRLNI